VNEDRKATFTVTTIPDSSIPVGMLVFINAFEESISCKLGEQPPLDFFRRNPERLDGMVIRVHPDEIDSLNKRLEF